MSAYEIAGMEIRDFHAKCSGSIFLVDDTVYSCEECRATERFDEEDYPEDEEVEGVVYGRVIDTISTSSPYWKDESTTIADFRKKNISFVHPPMGYFNYNFDAIYIARKAVRQWKLGLSTRNLSVRNRFNIDRDTVGLGRFTDNDLHNCILINEVFNPFYPTWQVVVNAIRKGHVLAGAISQHLALRQSVFFPHILICYKDIPVGFISSNDEWFLFSTAEYVGRLLPAPFTIKEDLNDVAIRGEWG